MSHRDITTDENRIFRGWECSRWPCITIRFNDMATVAVGRGLLHFEDARVPENHLLGEEGEGFSQVMQGFDFSRALIGLQCIGPAQVSVEETWEYVTHSEAFDQP